jgi:glycosyltransferase involved in cell wall biosynthesis
VRLFFDCRAVRWGTHDGISRYSANLVRELSKLTPVTMIINDERQLEMLPDLPWIKTPAMTSPLDSFMSRYLNPHHPDLVFSPMQTMGSLGRRYKLVLTVHDLIYYTHRTPPRNLPQAVRVLWRLYHLVWWPQRMLLNRADAVAAVSRTTIDLIRRKKLTTKPVILAPNASSLEAPAATADGTATDPAAQRPREKSLVYMGSFMPYKNVETLVTAMNDLPDHTLHLMSPMSAETQERFRALNTADNLVIHDGASDAEYIALLQSSTALVSASLDEGFGIPLVEAMAFGVPVVVSDITIFHEIAGDSGTYVDPRDAAAFVSAIRDLEAPGRWQQLSESSVAQAATWSWERSAAQLWEGLQAVVDESLVAE